MLDFLFYRIYHIGEIFNFDMLKSQKLFLSPLREVVVVAVLLDQWPPTLSSSPTSSPSLALSCPSLSSSPSCLSSRMQGLFLIGWSRSVLVIAFTASINFGREQVTSAPLLVQICMSYSALSPQSFCETGPHLHRSGTTVRDRCRTFCFKFWHNKSLFFLAEGDVLLGQEVMVPVLCLQTQASQQTLQLLLRFQGRGKRSAAGWKECWLFQSSRLSSRLLFSYLLIFVSRAPNFTQFRCLDCWKKLCLTSPPRLSQFQDLMVSFNIICADFIIRGFVQHDSNLQQHRAR